MRILQQHAVGLIVDVQERLFPVMRNQEQLTANLQTLIRGLASLRVPMVVTEQYRKGLGETIEPIRSTVEEATGAWDPVEKSAFSCCDEPDILRRLEQLGRNAVIIAGIEAHVCVLQTSMDLLTRGYTPVVVSDALSSRKEHDQLIAERRMEQRGAVLTSYESILFELTRYSRSDTFKAISALVK
jgi:nicotinamidase-related amidase